ncbi:hypothetical protein K2173_002930 [Erythroxylum novogranatense]|uniref:Homeobox domain-containing protein n=1 Tax=Erythroxylum novogranatense TaxID=1862640 RepID=A0AAV8TU23_9ROSI|nr:hypothetical protein K2173_002930 [Erythroxylum novogranatense]
MEERMSGFFIAKAGNVRGGGGGGNNAGTGTKCGRWNPTTEQVKVLTDLFRSGLRTPSTDQIQKISSQLSLYGKIESKNVFYWFQNHKARERQKRRRVSVGEKNVIRRQDIFSSSARYYSELDLGSEPERVLETLQLFPVNSFRDSESEKLKLRRNECKEAHAFSYTCSTEMDHPPLDLRLSSCKQASDL